MIILTYGTVTALHKPLFPFLKHSSERPCEQEFFFFYEGTFKRTYRYVLLALENSCREVEALRKKGGKNRVGLKGKS